MERRMNHRLLVFVPEGDRTSKTIPVDLQDKWTIRVVMRCATLFEGATAYGRGVGAWHDPNRSLHWDRVTVVESWVDPETPRLRARFRQFLRVLEKMRVELRQQAIGCMLDGRWMGPTDLE